MKLKERSKVEIVYWKRKKATKREQVSYHVMKVTFEVGSEYHSDLANQNIC